MNGTIRKRNGHYFLRIYVGRKQRELALGSTDDLPSRKQLEDAAANLRLRLGIAGSGARISLEQFAEHWYLSVVQGRLRPSTAHDYLWRFNRYIKGRREARLPLWEYRTRDVQNLVDSIARDHPGLAKASHQRIKALLSGVFRHAVVAGFREGNPVRDCFLPRGRSGERATGERREPGVYSLDEVNRVLKLPRAKLPEPVRVAVALAAFAGLRLAELRGLAWEDYDGKSITVRRTVWRAHESDPKSRASAAAVPVVGVLREVLDAYRATLDDELSSEQRDEDGNVIEAPRRLLPANILPLARYHLRRAFAAVGSEWRGFHAFRRGLASTLFQLGAEDIVVQRILRHARVIVTREHYIKQFDSRVSDAMNRLGAEANKGRVRGKKRPVASEAQ
jgi:integrase